MAAPSWTLENCCGTLEITFLCLFAGYMVINFFLWNTFVVKPMKLIAVFVHEMSHATACWMTGGSVKGIEVHRNEGGVTKYVGGVRYIVIPAGYLGGAFWGGFFVTLSGDRIASTVAASLFVFALLVSLKYSPNGTMIALCIGFIIVTLAIIFIEWFVFSPIIQFVTLYCELIFIYVCWNFLLSESGYGYIASARIDGWQRGTDETSAEHYLRRESLEFEV